MPVQSPRFRPPGWKPPDPWATSKGKSRQQRGYGADHDAIWEKAQAELKRVIADHELDHVAIERADEPPEQTTGGKFRQVIPLSDA